MAALGALSISVVIIIAGAIVFVTVLPGAALWWPTRGHPDRRSDLGLALMSGAVIAFAVLAVQVMFDIRASDAEDERQAIGDRQNLQFQVARQRDLSSIALPGQDLSGFYLPDKKLTEANLEGTNLEGAVLPRSDLSRANIRGADFSGANLLGSKLTEAEGPDGLFTGADLSGAVLE